MPTASEFIKNFTSQLPKLSSENAIHDALQGLKSLDTENLHQEVSRKLITALRRKSCSVPLAKRNDPNVILLSWISTPLANGPGSGNVDNNSQEPGQSSDSQSEEPSQGNKRKSNRKKKRSKKASPEDVAPNSSAPGAGSGNGAPAPGQGGLANGLPPAPALQDQTVSGAGSGNGALASGHGNIFDGPLPPITPHIDPASGAGSGNGALASGQGGLGGQADPPIDKSNAGKVVLDQSQYVDLLGVIGRLSNQLSQLNAPQRPTSQPPPRSNSESPPPPPKRQRTGQQRPKSILKPSQSSHSLPNAVLGDHFDAGGQDQETRDILASLEEFCPTDEDEDIEIVDEYDASASGESDTGHHHPEDQPFDKLPSPPTLKALHLRPQTVRTRVLTHRNGLPHAIRWLQTKGLSLARFVSNYDSSLRSRDKQELEALSTALLLLVDQFQPQHVVLIDAADVLIRRIMSLCLQDKLDQTYLSVMANPSGSHLAPLEWLTEANKVYKIVKKAHSSSSSSPPPVHKSWRHRTFSGRQQDGNTRGVRRQQESKSHNKHGQSRNRHQAGQQSARKAKSDGGKGAGNGGSSSNNQD